MDHERGRITIQLKEYTHDYVNREVSAIGGHYMFTKEVKLHFNERDILYLVGHGVVDNSCCGFGGFAYALVCGFVVSWKNKKNYDGVPVSEVEPILQAGRSATDITRQLLAFARKQTVHPKVLEIVTQGRDLSKASVGHRMQVTVLSSDIRNFTTLSETYPPDQVFQTLNQHFDVMTTAIQLETGQGNFGLALGLGLILLGVPQHRAIGTGFNTVATANAQLGFQAHAPAGSQGKRVRWTDIGTGRVRAGPADDDHKTLADTSR